MKFDAGKIASSRDTEAMSSDVRWTDEPSSGSGGGHRRKSAKCSSGRRVSRKVGLQAMTPTIVAAFQHSCPLPAMPGATVRLLSPSGYSGSSDSERDGRSSWSRSSSAARWHRYPLAVVLYIVGVVLVGAISTVHCDAVGSSSSSSSVSSNSSNQSDIAGQQLVASENSVELDPTLSGSSVYEDHYEGSGHYTHHWAVHIPEGGQETAERVADEHGFINHGKAVSAAAAAAQ